MSWLDSGERRPRAVYLVHGEAVPTDTLRLRVRDTLSIDAYAPKHLQTVELSGLTLHAAAEPTPA